ncbi:hypothetical protein ACQJBY_014949 [Aegilops geniculata]
MPFAGAIAPCITILLLLLLVPCAEGQPPEATTPGGLAIEQILSKNGCGAFAGLVAATAGVGQVLREQSDAGLTVFCPGDDAVAAFLPRFSNLTADRQASLLLYHGLAVRSSEVELSLLADLGGEIEVPTLDRGRWGYGMLTICDCGGTMSSLRRRRRSQCRTRPGSPTRSSTTTASLSTSSTPCWFRERRRCSTTRTAW